jgi:hypothetical protein
LHAYAAQPGIHRHRYCTPRGLGHRTRPFRPRNYPALPQLCQGCITVPTGSNTTRTATGSPPADSARSRAPPPCRRFSGCSALRLRWRCFTAGGLSLPFLLASWPHRLVGSWEEDVMQRLRCCSSQRGLGGAIGIGFILLALAIGGLEGTVM